MNKKGFTLIEIMIVGAILGILFAVAIPIFEKKAAEEQKASILDEPATKTENTGNILN